MALPKVTQYVKNVGKSVAYLSIDAVKANSSGISDFVDYNNEVIKTAYSSVRNYKTTVRNVNKSIRQSNVYMAVDAGVKNMLEDVKSGNLYNDRTADIAESSLGLNDDFDMDFNFEDSGSSTKSVSDSFNKAIGAAASSQNTIVAQSTNLVVKSNQASTQLVMAGMDKLTANLSSGLGSVYTGIDKTNQFLNGPMLAHIENSKRYYETTSSDIREQTLMIKELLEMQRNLYKAQDSNRKESRLNNSMRYNGSMDAMGYFKNVKGNISDIYDSMGLSMLTMDIGGGNPYMLYAAAPFKMVLEPMMQRLMSKDFKKALKSFDNGITTMFSQAAARMNKARDKDDGSLLSMLGKIFGISIDRKDSINTGNYAKGAVHFDGITRQAIIETIPGYLSRIEAALTGGGERHYDYKSGSWKSARQIQKEYDYEKKSAVAGANYDVRSDIGELLTEIRNRDAKAAEQLSKSVDKMMTKIFDDGGDFRPQMGKGKNGIGEIPAWKYYGFRSEREFDNVMKSLSKNTIRGMAVNNMDARQNLSNRMRDHEAEGGIYRQLYNGTYNESGTGSGKHSPSNFTGGSGLLSLSKDSDGHNVFWYLKEILRGITNRKSKNSRNTGRSYSTSSVNRSGSRNNGREGESSSESEGDSSTDDDIPWDDIERERREKAEEDASNKKFGNWIKDKLDISPIGRYFSNILGSAGSILFKPMEYATKLLNKADENIFKLMFGVNDFKDDEGKPIDSIFEYMMYRIKRSFTELTNWLKKNVFNKLKDVIAPYWEKYGKPVANEVKNYATAGFNRAKQGVSNTFGRGFDYLSSRLSRGGVVGADEFENAATSAGGRYVTKRGLTMISPGEIIIPASFDTREQNKMLALEKRDKSRILNSIGYNAKGTVDTEAFKKRLKDIYEENKGNGAKIGAGGVLGAGVGLLSGVNPLLGAMAGAGLSILSNSETFKTAIFGEEITNADGSTGRSGGIISKKIYDIFKKAAPDMGDFGIAGGLVGLFAPFGPLGGAALGAGIGFLKNSEGFKKFIFGDAETGKDGFISKESYDKMAAVVKKAVPNMAIGAGAGILLGPFGLLGNAVLGTGAGLLSSTDMFHEFVFGDPEDPTKGSLVGAINTGILEPTKEKMAEFAVSFSEYAKKNILNPMKNFWGPFQQAIKNTIMHTGDAIKDHINDMFERTIGIPMHDFLQEKLFKPITKTIFTILKAPVAVGKAIVAAPFRALGGIGNSMRMGQIQRGNAYDMSASERLAFRDQHQTRNFFGNLTGRDKMLEQDNMLANMTEEQLAALSSNAIVGLDSKATLQKKAGAARNAVGKEISSFFNSKGADGKNLYSKVNYNTVKKIAEIAADGDYEKASKLIDKQNLTEDEKNNLRNKIQGLVEQAATANKNVAKSGTSDAVLDMEVSNLIGRKFRGRKDRRQLYRSAEAELKSRNSATKAEESPEQAATNNFAELYKTKTDKIIELFAAANERLDLLINPDKSKDTTPPGDKANKMAAITDGSVPTTTSSSGTSGVIKAPDKAKTTLVDPKTGNIISSDPDAKENVENEKDRQEMESNEENQTSAALETSSTLKTLVGKFFGGTKEDKDGLLTKLGSGFGTFFNFLGIGAKFGLGALALGSGVSLLGYASEWFKTSVWPSIKTALFGTTNEDGTTTSGLLGGLGSSFKNVILGEDGKSGLLGGITTWFEEKFTSVKTWFEENGGFWGLIDKAAAKMVTGWGYAVDNIVAPLTAVVIKTLPSLLVGLASGILKGLKMAIFNKDLPNQDSTVELNTSDTLEELSSMNSSNSSSLSAAGGTFWDSIKNAFGTASSSAAYTANNVSSLDLASIFSSTSESSVSNETSSGINGLFGQTSRTNELEYDENGNITTSYVQYNTSDSGLSRLAGVAGEGFLRGLGGDAVTSGLGTALSKVSTSGVGTGLVKAGTSALGTAAKTTGNIMNDAGSLGTTVNSAIVDSLGTTAAKATAEVAEEASESVLKKGLTKIFTSLGDSLAGKLLVGAVSTEVTESIMKKTLIQIGEKLSEKACTKALGAAATKIGTAVAGFSPLVLALMVVDFGWGYDNAYTMLGVAVGGDYTVGFGQKCLCGLLNLINERITLGLLPTSTIIDVIVDYLFPLFGLSADELTAARDSAASVIEQWNLENPNETYDNLQDFNSKDKWWFKAGNAISDVASDAWTSVKSMASSAATMVSEGFNSVAEKVEEVVDNAMDIGSFIKTVTTNVIKTATDPEYSWDINTVITDDDPLAGAKRTLYQVLKIPLGVVGMVAAAGSLVYNKIKEFTDDVKDGASDAWSDVTNVMKGQYTIFSSNYWNFNNNDDDNPLGIVSKLSSVVVKWFGMVPAMVGYVGTKAKQTFNTIVSGAKEGALDASSDIDAVKRGEYTIFNASYWRSDTTDGNPLSTIGSIFAFTNRLFNAPSAMLGYVGTKAKEGFDILIAGAVEGALDASEDVNAVRSGEYTIFNASYWKSDAEDDGNPLSKLGSIFGFVTRLIQAPSAMLGYVGTKAKEGFDILIAGAVEGALDASEDVNAVKNGDYTVFSSDYWKSDAEDDGNPLSKLGSIFGFVTRLIQAPSAMLGYVGTKVTNTFKDMISEVTDGQKETDAVIAKVEAGTLSVFDSEYWKINTPDSALGIFSGVVSFIDRLTQAPILIFKSVFNKIKERFNEITGWFSKLFGEDAESTNTTNSGSGRAGKGHFKGVNYGLSHNYQSDDMISGMRYGDSTIGEAGCAPVAATNILNSLNRDTTVSQAAAYAERNNMTVPGGGTNINYFNSYLGSNGIATSNTSNKSNVLNALSEGNQVVMLGKDNNNASGVPFGTSPHFVTAKGIDSMGNIVAEDPDLPQSTVVYDKNTILDSMITSVIAKTGAKRKKSGRKRNAANRLNRKTSAIKGMGRVFYGLGGSLGADAVINVAKSQIGVVEEPTNKVKYNYAYYGSNVSGDAYPWCCAFVWWVFNQAGASDLFYGGGKTAYCPTLKSYYEGKNQNVTSPEPGDIVFFNWDGGSRAQHVGIVSEVVDSNNIITIEGNTGADNTNGGQVMQRNRSSSCIVGYARPNYPYTYNSSSVVDMSKYGGDSTDYGSIATDSASYDSSSSISSNLMTQFTELGTNMIKSMYGDSAYNAIYGDVADDDNGTTTETTNYVSTSSADLTGNTDAEKIWNYLVSKGYSKAGAAGIMGNLYAESGLRANNLQNTYETSLGVTDDTYTSSVNNGTRNKNSFKNDSAGYGLAQWTYNTRKQGLYESTIEQGKDINDLGGQLDYLHKEFGTYGLQNELMNATSYNDASDTVLEDYEKPAVLNYDTRRGYAQQMYNTYSGSGRAKKVNNNTGGAARALNSRSKYAGGSGTTTTSTSTSVDYKTFLETIVAVLMNISDNTAMLNAILELLSSNFNIDIDKSDIDAAASTTKEQTQSALNDLVQRSSGNNTNISKLLNNKDTEYIITAMQAIAQE